MKNPAPMETAKRFLCTLPHLNGQPTMYHYSDEVIYEKHLTTEAIIEERQSNGEYEKV